MFRFNTLLGGKAGVELLFDIKMQNAFILPRFSALHTVFTKPIHVQLAVMRHLVHKGVFLSVSKAVIIRWIRSVPLKVRWHQDRRL